MLISRIAPLYFFDSKSSGLLVAAVDVAAVDVAQGRENHIISLYCDCVLPVSFLYVLVFLGFQDPELSLPHWVISDGGCFIHVGLRGSSNIGFDSSPHIDSRH